MDSTTLMVISSAIAGLASGITEQTFSAAGGLVEKMHNRNKPTAAAQMTANITAFATELNAQIGRLAESAEVIASRVEQPAVVVQLQSALVSASQTDSHEVHTLLAGLVSQRLRIENDTTAARACHRACQVVADLTSAQLKMLGFLYTLGHMHFGFTLGDFYDDEAIFEFPDIPSAFDAIPLEAQQAYALKWVQEMLGPYGGLTCTALDRMNLYAFGCCLSAEQQWPLPSGKTLLENALSTATGHDLVYADFASTELGVCLEEAYKHGSMLLTSVGSVLGMFVADQLANRPTDLTTWDG